MVNLDGLVIAVRPRWVLVRVAGAEISCDIPKSLKQGPREQRTLVAVGDRVVIEPLDQGHGIVRELKPRGSKISRVGSVRPLREQVIAANVDQLLALQAVRFPRFNRRGLDRLLVLGEAGGVDCAICMNKIDLAQEGEVERIMDSYRDIGYPLFATSAIEGDGLRELGDFLRDHETVLLGPSGVGKSTLLNRLIPGAGLRTGRMSHATGKGTHTTARIEYLDLPEGGAVLDTPGLRAIQPWTLPEELAEHFPEMRPFLGSCHFQDCLHRSEPGCAILEAISRGQITTARHDSYLRILRGLADKRS
jgi:ribosome biogenesis GTPase